MKFKVGTGGAQGACLVDWGLPVFLQMNCCPQRKNFPTLSVIKPILRNSEGKRCYHLQEL